MQQCFSNILSLSKVNSWCDGGAESVTIFSTPQISPAIPTIDDDEEEEEEKKKHLNQVNAKSDRACALCTDTKKNST